jgi:hypothetical protein
MTRPRMAGSVHSWTVLLAVVMKVCTQKPSAISTRPKAM